MRKPLWTRRPPLPGSGRYACFVHRDGYVLQQHMEQHHWRVSGDWTLYPSEQRGKSLGRYSFYGQIKIQPPTTWANKLIAKYIKEN